MDRVETGQTQLRRRENLSDRYGGRTSVLPETCICRISSAGGWSADQGIAQQLQWKCGKCTGGQYYNSGNSNPLSVSRDQSISDLWRIRRIYRADHRPAGGRTFKNQRARSDRVGSDGSDLPGVLWNSESAVLQSYGCLWKYRCRSGDHCCSGGGI